MSIRAYRVNKIDTEESDSFNLWHNEDRKLRDFLFEESHWEALNDDGCGLIEVEVEQIKKAIKKHKELEIEDYTLENLKKDVKWAEKNGDDYIQYYCY